MSVSTFTRFVLNRAELRMLPLFFLVLLAGSSSLYGQVMRVGNRDIAAHVVTERNQGRFWITGGSDYGDTLKFLYASSPQQISSNIIFQVKRNGTTNYYSNLPATTWPNNKPKDPQTGLDIRHRAFDSSYVSANGRDTLAIVWKNLDGYDITLRFMPEDRQTSYDRGSDMLIEFDYTPSRFSTTGELGILLMLDVYNNNANSTSGGGTGDGASILTSSGYYPSGSPGKKFVPPFDQIPAWYHVGNFTMGAPLNTVFPIHRLRDTSHGGTRLTTPSMFAIGHWLDFARVGWDPASTIGVTNVTDAATIVRWEALQGEGKVVTAFGMSDKGGNNMFTCRDTALFLDIRAQRVSEQKVANGPFSPQQIEVEMWVTNTEFRYSNNVDIELTTPFITSPLSTGRLTIDPSTPARQGVALAPSATKKIRWLLNVAPGTPDTVEVELRFNHIYEGKLKRTFRQQCTPKITLLGFRTPPPPEDTVSPVINRTGSGRDTTAFTTFTTFDRHPGYNYDTGLNRVQILSSTNYNLFPAPANFTRCDIRTDLTLDARVVDTTLPAKIVFRVLDCRDNYTDDSVSYMPFPDPFNPRIERVDTTDRGTSLLCNARVYEVRLSDTLQTATAGDAGFGLIEVVGTADNFRFDLNYDNGGVPIAPMDTIATFRVTVLDTMRDGRIEIRYADAAGNDSTMEFTYCTLPDVLPPVAIAVASGDGKSWTVDASDTLGWDRGLYSVNILENRGNNMRMLPDPATITPGDPLYTFRVEVINDAMDAYMLLEVTDLKHLEQPAGHADTLLLIYPKVQDERAPNIRFVDVADPDSIHYDVVIDDIHYDGTDLYRYDLGLATVRTLLVTSNIARVTPISFSQGDTTTTFRVTVIDTLAFRVIDTLVVEATDLAGNITVDTLFYPIKPDRLTPVFDGQMDAGRTVITGQVNDDRAYDRGLGSVTLENAVNLDPQFALDNLNGLKTSQVTIRVTDPEQPISGTIVLRDLVGDRDRTVESQQIHAVRIPFALPVAAVTVVLPEVVEGGAEISAAVVATRSFSSSDVSAMTFDLLGSASASYARATDLVVTPTVPGRYTVRFESAPGAQYASGDTLGRIFFRSSESTGIQRFDLQLTTDAPVANDNRWSTIYAFNSGDTVGTLRLPPPLLKLTADSLTWINGTCERILRTRPGTARIALSILGVKPQPVSTGGDRSVEIDVRDLPAEGGVAELLAADGTRLATYTLSPSAGQLIRIRIDLPDGISSGVYFFRVTANTGVDVARVVVVD